MDRIVEAHRLLILWGVFLFLSFFTITSTPEKLYAAVDTEPPTSYAALVGNGNGYFYTSSVAISIYSIDTPSGLSQNVKYTAYRINSGAWTQYTGPFMIHFEGNYTISFFSEDHAGNPEQVKTIQFEIIPSTSPPTPETTHSAFVTVTPTPHPFQFILLTSTPTPDPFQYIFVTPTPTAVPTATTGEVPTLSPSVVPTQSAASAGLAYPASFPYYRSPTKTLTPTPKKVQAITTNRQGTPERVSATRVIFSPTPTAHIVNESVILNDTDEPPAVLGKWTNVNDGQSESFSPWIMLIVAVLAAGGYIVFVYYLYLKIYA